jgi:hypothetical protein
MNMVAKWPTLLQSASRHTTAHPPSVLSASLQPATEINKAGKASEVQVVTRTPIIPISEQVLRICLGLHHARPRPLLFQSRPWRNLDSALIAGPIEANLLQLFTPIRRDRSCTTGIH